MRQTNSPIKLIGFTAIILLLLLIATVIAVLYYPKYAHQKLEFIAAQNQANVFSDLHINGNSIVKEFIDAEFDGFHCTLKRGYDYPFCISQYQMTDSRHLGVNLNEFDEIRIYGDFSAPSHNDFLRVSLLNFNPRYSNIEKTSTSKYNSIELQAHELNSPITIKLQQLAVPTWWAANMKEFDVGTHQELDNVTFIEIGTGTGASMGSYQLKFNRIELIKNTIPIKLLYEKILISWAAIITFLVCTIGSYLVISLKKTQISEQNLIAINEMLSVKSAQLERVSQHDELTGLLNRTGLKTRMVDYIEKQPFPISIAMVDIDFFKKINDNFGHHQGDHVLTKLGKLLQEFILEGETAARFGGEEFILLLPGHGIADALYRLEKLRVLISKIELAIGHKLTASIGVATAHKYSEFTQMIEIADKALYRAKQEGRNCIRVSV